MSQTVRLLKRPVTSPNCAGAEADRQAIAATTTCMENMAIDNDGQFSLEAAADESSVMLIARGAWPRNSGRHNDAVISELLRSSIPVDVSKPEPEVLQVAMRLTGDILTQFPVLLQMCARRDGSAESAAAGAATAAGAEVPRTPIEIKGVRWGVLLMVLLAEACGSGTEARWRRDVPLPCHLEVMLAANFLGCNRIVEFGVSVAQEPFQQMAASAMGCSQVVATAAVLQVANCLPAEVIAQILSRMSADAVLRLPAKLVAAWLHSTFQDTVDVDANLMEASALQTLILATQAVPHGAHMLCLRGPRSRGAAKGGEGSGGGGVGSTQGGPGGQGDYWGAALLGSGASRAAGRRAPAMPPPPGSVVTGPGSAALKSPRDSPRGRSEAQHCSAGGARDAWISSVSILAAQFKALTTLALVDMPLPVARASDLVFSLQSLSGPLTTLRLQGCLGEVNGWDAAAVASLAWALHHTLDSRLSLLDVSRNGYRRAIAGPSYMTVETVPFVNVKPMARVDGVERC